MNENDQAYYQEQYPSNQQPTARKYRGGLGKDYTVDMVFCIHLKPTYPEKALCESR